MILCWIEKSENRSLCFVLLVVFTLLACEPNDFDVVQEYYFIEFGGQHAPAKAQNKSFWFIYEWDNVDYVILA